MKAKLFFNKLMAFTKRNLSAMAVSFCMILSLSLVTAVAVTRMNKNTSKLAVKQTAVTTTPEEKNMEQVVPTASNDVVEFVMPVEGATEGLPFAMDKLVKFQTLGKWQTHSGIDLIALAGTKVVCVFDGTVESVESTSLWGNIVVVDHGDGLKTIYKSLSGDVLVSAGDKIKKGEQIGSVSSSAKAELDQGAHLHFEVMLNEEYKDPWDYLPSGNK